METRLHPVPPFVVRNTTPVPVPTFAICVELPHTHVSSSVRALSMLVPRMTQFLPEAVLPTAQKVTGDFA